MSFAAKLNSSGSLTWNTFLGGSGTDNGYAIAVDGSGNVNVAGDSTATWGATVVRAYTAGTDGFVAKLNSSGTKTWGTFLGGSGTDSARAIAVDSSGNIYVAGYSTATWGTPVQAFSSGTDAFAAEVNSSGSLTWNTFLGGAGTDQAYAIDLDSSNNVYVAGDSTATWGTPVRAYSSGTEAFVAKLNNSGTLLWNTFLGGSGADDGYAIAVDSSGNVYVAGDSAGTWGSPVLAYSGGTDAYIAKLNSSGSLIWNGFLGGSGSDVGLGLAIDASNNAYVAGYSIATWGSPVPAFQRWDRRLRRQGLRHFPCYHDHGVAVGVHH